MAIALGYKNRSGDFVNLEAYILHPDHLLETWVILTNAFMEEGEESVNIEQIDFKQSLEEIFNTRLPGLKIDATHNFYIDDTNQVYQITFDYQRLPLSPEHIMIHHFHYQPLAQENKRSTYLHHFFSKKKSSSCQS